MANTSAVYARIDKELERDLSRVFSPLLLWIHI